MLPRLCLLKDPRAHDRNDRHGHKQGGSQRKGNGQGEGQHELTHQTGGKDDREEDADRGQSGADYGSGHLLCPVDSRVRGGKSLIPQTVDVFDDHNGIVHQHSDGQRQAEEGHHIDRNPGKIHDDDSRQDREGDGEGHHQSRPDIKQKDREDQHRQTGTDQHTLEDRADDHVDIVSLVHQTDDVKPRILRLQVLDHLLYQIGYLRGSRGAPLEDGKDDAPFSVDLGIGIPGVIGNSKLRDIA